VSKVNKVTVATEFMLSKICQSEPIDSIESLFYPSERDALAASVVGGR
jgi:hypothetical protein